MVTLAGTQNLNEFELHARAVLGLPIPEITLQKAAASAVVLADKEGVEPEFTGLEMVLAEPRTDIRIFGKPSTRPYRRMAVVLCNDDCESDIRALTKKASLLASKVKVEPAGNVEEGTHS
jgi:phosphoribosylglycinamide formyltransferase 2